MAARAAADCQDTQSPLQFGELRIPHGPRPAKGYPVVIFLHGGGWTADWNTNYAARLAERIAGLGFATWNVEYRRLGDVGGGFPGTFNDVAQAADFLKALTPRYGLGGVDEFEPVSGGGDVDHAHGTGRELIVSVCDGAVDFQSAEHALDAVALLVERPVMFDLHPAV